MTAVVQAITNNPRDRQAARDAVNAIRAAIANPTLAGERGVLRIDLSRPHRVLRSDSKNVRAFFRVHHVFRPASSAPRHRHDHGEVGEEKFFSFHTRDPLGFKVTSALRKMPHTLQRGLLVGANSAHLNQLCLLLAWQRTFPMTAVNCSSSATVAALPIFLFGVLGWAHP